MNTATRPGHPQSADQDPVAAAQPDGHEVFGTAGSAVTETVVRRHLQAFLDQQGVAAIVSEYSDNASFVTEDRIYRGKHEIAEFFTDFIASLPVNAIERFTLRSLQVDRNVAYITWSVGSDIPLGTDTFVVEEAKIVSQTFALHPAFHPAPRT